MNIDNKHITIEVQDLAIGYTSRKKENIIVSNLNFKIKRGSFVCILGKNGIGKSTLLKTLSRVQNPIDGHVKLENKNINTYSNLQLAKNLSLILTEKLPESNLTVYELIALGRQPYTNWIGALKEKDIEAIEKSIKLTNIAHLVSKKYFELSDGQFQRVLISRALAQDTNTIILDEPTVHLDIEHTLETFQLLQKLAIQENKTIIASTHQIQLALQTASEIFLMTEKEFLIGTPKELISKNHMDKLFDNESIIFDPIKEQFLLKKTP